MTFYAVKRKRGRSKPLLPYGALPLGAFFVFTETQCEKEHSAAGPSRTLNQGMIAPGNHCHFDSLRGAPRSLQGYTRVLTMRAAGCRPYNVVRSALEFVGNAFMHSGKEGVAYTPKPNAKTSPPAAGTDKSVPYDVGRSALEFVGTPVLGCPLVDFPFMRTPQERCPYDVVRGCSNASLVQREVARRSRDGGIVK